MRFMQSLLGIVAGFAFLALLGSAGTYDPETITLGQSLLQSLISLVVLVSSICLSAYLDKKGE